MAVLGIQLAQGIPKHVFINIACNIVYISVLFSTFVLTSHYLSNTKAFYLSNQSRNRIETLAEAMDDPNVRLIVSKGTHFETLINHGTSDVLKETSRRMQLYPENFIDRKDIRSQCLDRVRDFDNMACFCAQSTIVEYISQNKEHGLYYTRESMTSALGQWVMRKDFKYKELFNKEIAKLKEMGKFYLDFKIFFKVN